MPLNKQDIHCWSRLILGRVVLLLGGGPFGVTIDFTEGPITGLWQPFAEVKGINRTYI